MVPAQGTPAIRADLSSATDDALVAAAQFGDERAFEGLYRRYRADIRAFCSRSLPDPHIAEDLAQETFLRAFDHIGGFEPGRPVWPWLLTIAKRLCIDELRGRSRREALGRSASIAADGPYDATSEEALDRIEGQRLNRVLSGALAALRPRDRSVFVLQTIEGRSHEEIARQEGLSVHAVRNLAWRARRALRRSLRNERVRNWGLIFGFRPRSPRPRRVGSLRRWRPRPWIDRMLEGTVVERAAAIALGLASAGAVFFGGDFAAPEPRNIVFEAARPTPVGDAAAQDADPSRPAGQSDAGRSISPPPVVAASVSLGPKEPGAAAPSGGRLRMDVQSANGDTVLWYEHGVSCGRQGTQALPREGPVTLVC